MPIADEVYRVVNEGQSAEEAYRGLLGTHRASRDARPRRAGMIGVGMTALA